MLTADITLLLHPIDTEKFPTVPPGWRWAVMVDHVRDVDGSSRQAAPADLARCANAGWCPTMREAALEGEQNASTALKALRVLGIRAEARKTVLESDPIPAGGDVLIEKVKA